ncbi:MAG: hypothetical protein CBB72_011485 [Muricauda sp. TMED12]|nr:MAG: hypothetical protein CBB72_011485 [Muricauda sp. TMED12]
MIELEAAGQTVYLNDDLLRSRQPVGMSLSGGADSALLFYLACKYVPEAKYFPWCGIDVARPPHIWFAREIFQMMKERFPHVDIPDKLYEFDIDVKDPKERARAMAHPMWKHHVAESKEGGATKRLICAHNEMLMRHKYKYWNIFLNGMTAAPPQEICETWPIFVESRRYKVNLDGETFLNNVNYRPFRNVDKKWVAGMYEKEGLMEWLYPYTASCTGYQKETKSFTEPCKNCFWCREKYWAFGQYDLCFDR